MTSDPRVTAIAPVAVQLGSDTANKTAAQEEMKQQVMKVIGHAVTTVVGVALEESLISNPGRLGEMIRSFQEMKQVIAGLSPEMRNELANPPPAESALPPKRPASSAVNISSRSSR